MKFNMDGPTRGNLGEVRIGRVSRNSLGEIKITFSKSVIAHDANFAELCVVLEVFIIFVSSKWQATHSLLIVSDSSNVVKWVNDSKMCLGNRGIGLSKSSTSKEDDESEEYSHLVEC
ncbi:hypothetical protein POUND7_008299 [Theobroma cacao]